MLTRALKFVNVLIAVLLIAAAGLVYWYAWRPLPQVSGDLQAPLQAGVTVTFDPRGVPHVRGANLDDVLFTQGYVTAQDRLFQMDVLRRYAAGELAEVFGPAALENDRELRAARLRRIAEAAYITLPAADREVLAAYTRGVNYYISRHLQNLPLEFKLAGYQPRPWSVVDCLLMALNMVRNLTNSWPDEILKSDMMRAGDPAKVNVLFPVRIGNEPQPGSNAWAISGSRTTSGKPILSNDMHLEYQLPGIWYMVHLEAPDLNVAGVSLPGTPGVIVGHNKRIAWGITNLQFDVQDLYIERIDGNGRYLFRGQTEQARAEREVIRVKGQAPQIVNTWVTRHGPVIATDNNQKLALRWTETEPGALQFPIIELNRAGNWQEFQTALTRFAGPGSNFVYADVDGNIGYHAVGLLPIRRHSQGDVPVDGSSGEFEWDGFMPFDQLPSAFNPASGMVVTSNQNPFPPDYPYTVNGNFAPAYRARQVRALIASRPKWSAKDLLRVQTDIYSEFYVFLAKEVVAAYDRRGRSTPAVEPALRLLRTWNGQMDHAQAAPLVAELIYRHLRSTLAEVAAPGKGGIYDFQTAASAVEQILRTRPAGWFSDYDAMLVGVLSDAVDEATRMQGHDATRWRWGRFLRIGVNHPIFHQVPWVGSYFDLAPVEMDGSRFTVKQTTSRLAPSMRMNADLSDWDRSLLNLPIGQSGQILSSHYRDEWSDYLAGRSYPMAFRKEEVKSTLQLHPLK